MVHLAAALFFLVVLAGSAATIRRMFREHRDAIAGALHPPVRIFTVRAARFPLPRAAAF